MGEKRKPVLASELIAESVVASSAKGRAIRGTPEQFANYVAHQMLNAQIRAIEEALKEHDESSADTSGDDAAEEIQQLNTLYRALCDRRQNLYTVEQITLVDGDEICRIEPSIEPTRY